VDSLGVKAGVKGSGKVGKDVAIGLDTKGTLSGSVDFGVGAVKVGSNGTVTVKVAPGGPVKGSVAFNPSEATMAVGLSVGKEWDTRLGTVKAELSAQGAMKGMTQQDARRALDGWLVPTQDDVNAKLLREQQLRAQLKR